jgi:hypothetical protein
VENRTEGAIVKQGEFHTLKTAERFIIATDDRTTIATHSTFVDAYHAALRVHDTVAQNRVRFAQRLTEMSDELLALAREGERLRKLHKENGLRYERNVQESEMMMEKVRRGSTRMNAGRWLTYCPRSISGQDSVR